MVICCLYLCMEPQGSGSFWTETLLLSTSWRLLEFWRSPTPWISRPADTLALHLNTALWCWTPSTSPYRSVRSIIFPRRCISEGWGELWSDRNSFCADTCQFIWWAATTAGCGVFKKKKIRVFVSASVNHQCHLQTKSLNDWSKRSQDFPRFYRLIADACRLLSEAMFPAVSGRQTLGRTGRRAVQRSTAHQTEREPPHAWLASA